MKFFAVILFISFASFRIAAQEDRQKSTDVEMLTTIAHSSVKNVSPIKTVAGDENSGNQISGNLEIIESGVLNDQAIYLSQPVYPATAKAANAKGAVNVEVLVNAKGIVIKAKAVSGNALLRNTAEWAARRTKFKPAKKGENPALVKGIIVYNF